MTWANVPWMVAGGRHDAELGRALAYQASGGGEGVGSYLDCKAQANVVVDNKIRVSPGVVTMLNRYSGGARQSYVGYNPTDELVTIPATTSSGSRSDLVVARVIDQQYGGAVPASVENGPYMFSEVIANVPSTTTKFSQLGLAYPAVEICRIDRPSSTNTVSQGQIVDLRKLTRARRETFTKRYQTVNGSQYGYQAGQSDGVLTHNIYPLRAFTAFTTPVPVPSWAGRMIIRVNLTSIGFTAGATYGEFILRLTDGTTSIDTTSAVFDVNNYNTTYGDLVNADFLISDDRSVPLSWLGGTVTAQVLGQVFGPNPQITADVLTWRSSAITVNIEFIESI